MARRRGSSVGKTVSFADASRMATRKAGKKKAKKTMPKRKAAKGSVKLGKPAKVKRGRKANVRGLRARPGK